jgi:hypothetical protein
MAWLPGEQARRWNENQTKPHNDVDQENVRLRAKASTK